MGGELIGDLVMWGSWVVGELVGLCMAMVG